ncbi:MAG: hypothetical protein JWR26_4792 [Pedosphaera sp.]|nr:hypothetical protein [Pedosphaera sp.]
MERVLSVLEKIGAVKIGEACTPADEVGNFYFKAKGKWIVLVVEEWTAIKLIASQPFINIIKTELASS